MNIKNLFKKETKKVNIDKDLVSTVGTSSFFNIDGTVYNPDNVNAKTYKKISKHYQVSAALAIISYSIQQIDWFIKTEDKKVEKVLTHAISKIWNSLIRSTSKAYIYGYSPNIKVFTIEEIDGKQYYIYKKIRDLNPENCTVKVDKYGNYDGFVYKKDSSIDKKEIAPMYSFWYVAGMENGNQYGESMLKKIYKPWWYNEKIHTFANRYYERFGEPLIVGRAPSGSTVQDESGNAKSAQDLMKSIIENIRNHSSAQLPSDRETDSNEYLYDIKYIESQMRGFDFGNYLDRLDMEITKGLLLPELALGGGKGGSYALGSAQIEVFYTNLMGMMDNIVDYINAYVIPQLLAYNFPANKKAEFTYQPLSMDNKKFITDLIMESVKKGTMKPDIDQLEERSGIGLAEQKEKVAPKVKPVQDVKKIAESRTKELFLSEKEKTLRKKLEEVSKIRDQLIKLYPNE